MYVPSFKLFNNNTTLINKYQFYQLIIPSKIPILAE